jgi:hypothetical protein
VRTLAVLLLPLLAGFQEPRNGDSQKAEWFGFSIKDTETGEYRAQVTGLGKGDFEKGTAELTRVHVRYFIRPTQHEPGHRLSLFANTCVAEGIGREGSSGKEQFRFSNGLRVLIDDQDRLWTSEGTFDMHKQVLKCPKTTHLVRIPWPAKLDLPSTLAFMDPQELEWLRLFGAPQPEFELVGDEFEFDAASNVFTAGKKGRIRVTGRPQLSPDQKPSRKKSADPAELRCEGQLRLRSLGSIDPEAPTTLHITAEKDVVIERRTKETVTRVFCDSASIYLAVPPRKLKGDATPQAAVLKGNVRLEGDGGFSAAADRLEWNHHDDVFRLKGAPLVEVTQGRQRLVAREVLVDRWNRTVDFKGDIAATFMPARAAPGAERAGGMMTLTPGALQLKTDAAGRPYAVHASKGVRLSNPLATGDALEADGTEFEWDFHTGEGALRGSPFARIRQGVNLVIAPLVTFRGDAFDESLMVIKGPKLIKFFIESKPPVNPNAALVDAALGLGALQQKPREPALNSSAVLLESSLGLAGLHRIAGRKDAVTDLVISCDGDAVFDQQSHFVKLVDRCLVRTQDSTLTADRLFVFLAENGKSFDRVIGLGSVRASQSQGPGGASFRIEGETLEMREDPAQGHRTVRVVGFPTGRGQWGSDDFTFGEMTYNLSDKTFSMTRPEIPLGF